MAKAPATASPRFGDALGHGMSDKRIEILRGIGRSGSISQAARDAGVSYKAAWQAVATLTNLAGVPLVASAVGGAGGGGATLTAHGAQLLELAQALDLARRAVQTGAEAAGGAGAGTAVARLAIRTSMRNQLPATVEAVESTGRLVRVRLALGGSQRIAARITRESAELLGLAEGMQAIALCKATAVRVERASAEGRPKGNHVVGVVAGVARGDDGDEISVALEGGLQLVGFAPSGTALRGRQRVLAAVDEAAVVVALPG
ncbi:TOBE domain-containing protein [Variovorax sp. J22P271]|uniref:TOBE-like domain-containing protein n=1 Tax=Variovorax davisae TaxID=3053515 RepID=UPI0025753530|nr:TOBE domain-containing protein [Variovorax sp. J22P271]MDM0034653.1 TOBE domain-containing protein [Variovorax sp. J22P271]